MACAIPYFDPVHVFLFFLYLSGEILIIFCIWMETNCTHVATNLVTGAPMVGQDKLTFPEHPTPLLP